MAYTYWSLGKAFIHLSLQKINEAKELYARVDKNHLDKFSYENLANNLCYYNLEYFIKLNEELKLISVKTTKYKNTLKLRDSVLATLKNRFKSFEEIINRKKLPSNLYDTAAWYYYQMYLLEKNKSFLEKAKKYCKRIFGSINYSPFIIRSGSLHIRHIEEIMSTKYQPL